MKRPSDSDEGDLPAKRVHSAMDSSHFVRDADYYLQDGDLVILVDKTLFRVHRFILCRDSSTFQNMLKLCTGKVGFSDDNPLTLHGDTVEAVRSLLSVLYALPDQLLAKIEAFRETAGLDSLLTLAEIVNKYHFSTTEKRLMDIFSDYVDNNAIHFYDNATADDFKRALHVAMIQNNQSTLTFLSNVFASRVFLKTIPAPLALEIGNTYSLRSLQGAAYYIYLMEATAENDGEGTFDVFKFGQGIDENMKIRLLHGYWSLMRICLRLRSTPPLDEEMCEAFGMAEWRRSYNIPFNDPSPDLLGLLKKIQQSLRDWCYDNLQPVTLPNHVISHLNQECQRVKNNLMDHFEPCR